MKNKEKDLVKIKVFHHNDMDGYASALTFKKIYLNTYIKEYPIDFHPIDYTVDITPMIGDEPSLLVFLDYSFSNKINIKAVNNATNNYGCKLIWIDHHVTSLKPGVIGSIASKEAAIYVTPDHSGAYLTWKLFCYYSILNQRIYPNAKSLDDFFNKINYIITTHKSNPKGLAGIRGCKNVYSFVKIPEFIRMIDAYDRHDLSNKYYKDGVVLSQWFFVKVTNLENAIFNSFFKLHSIENTDELSNRNTFENIICTEAATISQVTQDLNDNFREQYKFEVIVRYHDIDNNICEASGICCNRQMNSIGFSEDYNKYDITIPFFFSGKNNKWQYSMYTRKENINVGLICGAFGGGGHPGAAGFISDRCIFDYLETTENGIKILDDSLPFMYHLCKSN